MPDILTWGHLFVGAAALASLGALLYALTWFRHRGFVRGTPQYARARDARRFGLRAAAAALLLLAIGCLTPLCNLPVA